MTSDRPYRPSEMTLEMAIDELRRCCGTQFDPDVVEAVVAAADRGDLRSFRKTGHLPGSGQSLDES